MRLNEFEGKTILKKYGVDIPKGHLINKLNDLDKIDFSEYVIKAQVSFGERKKSGLIKIANKDNLRKEVDSILGKEFNGKTVDSVLVEQKLDTEKEFYLSLALDTFEKKIVCMFSKEGGIDIERLAETNPEKITKFFVENEDSIKEVLKDYPDVSLIALKLYKIMKEMDAELVEINPIASVDGKLIALDSKVILDDNALFRHKDYVNVKKSKLDKFERRAWECRLHFVDLDGDVGIVGVGAGLVMATMDLINFHGMKPAFFLDAGGGADTERMKCAMEIISRRKPRKVFLNIFGGITRCNEIADAIAQYKKEHGIKIPMVIRIVGTNEKQAREILEKNDIEHVSSVEDAVKKLEEI